MKLKVYLKLTVMAGAVGLMTTPAGAQTAAQPADGALPEIEVIQKKTPLATAVKKKRPAAQAASPAAQEAPAAVQAETLENSPYGAAASGPASERAEAGPLPPINAKAVVPGDLQNAQGGASRITTGQIDDFRPATVHEALVRVPGVSTISDDGFGRHSGIGIRGSMPRRSRKILVLEDGVPINFSTYLDSSTHYTPPIERIESVEVFRGPIVNYGPLNNHGVLNFRNLSPFGGNETVIKAGIGHTEGSDKSVNNFRHVHTRQNLGNAGVVASYSGADAGGSWDVEELGYNDFYGAIGLRGTNQDLTISGGYFRQRDTYDEDNIADQDDFFRYRRNKRAAGLAGALDEAETFYHNLSSYNADYYRLQVAHNLYLDKNTTISTRIYGNDHERARFYPNDEATEDTLVMEGRDRRYRNYGADSRLELANLPLFGGITHTLQAGVRYEEHFFKNQNRVGDDDEVLTFGNKGAPDGAPHKLEAEAFAAFAQTAIHLTPSLTVTPGVRLESYDVSFRDLGDAAAGGSASYDHVLPMLSFAWEAAPRTTIYGGYHRGLTPHIIRDAINDLDVFEAPPEEIGDNFEIGLRSTAIRGVTVDMAVFHNRIDNYQYGEAYQEDGDRVFSTLDEAKLTGFEIYGRLDSQPFTNGPWNFFGEATYTYIDAEIARGVDTPDEGLTFVNVAGNRLPETFKHFAHLTLGASYRDFWDASVSWTYRGDYHTDALNSSFEDEGLVPDVWLLSARTNLKVTNELTLWATGHNLTDEFYISERSDGIKPGVGRTVMGGFTWKFD